MRSQTMTFVAMDPPRASFFALWDETAPGGIGARTASKSEYPKHSVVDVDVVLPAKRGTTRTTVAAEKLTISEAIDELAPLPRDATTSPSVAAWASVVRAALSLIARGRLLPWVSPAGYDMWRVDPLEPGDHQLVDALVEALPAVAHATPGGSTGAIADPTFAIRTAFDAIADAFVRTPAARRVGSLRVFADPTPTKVPHLRPWVNDLAAAHCASSRLVLRMHPPRGEDATVPGGDASDGDAQIELDPIEPTLLPADAITAGSDSDWHVVFALQSKSDPSLMVEARDYWMAPTEVMDRLGQQAETTLLAGLLTVSRLVKPWSNLLDDVAPTSAVLGDDDLDHFLEQLDDLEAAGISVRWPSELVAPKVERQLVVSAGAPGSGLATTLDLESLLDVDWEFLLDGVPLTAAELAVLAEAKRSVVSLRGRWVRLDRSTLEKLRAPAPKLTIGTALAAALNDSLGDEPGNADGSRLGFDEHEPVRLRFDGVLEALVDQLGQLTGQREASEPDQLHAELRNYQRRGLAWLTDLCKLGLGGCLADDMGLGKTIQILALHAQRRATADGAPTLVVCPTSLMQNWAREAAKFTPDFDVVVFHGPNRSLTNLTANCIVVTSYGVVRTDHERLDSVVWDLVVADEAQHAKNPRSRTAKALRQLTSGVRIALTGTPVENNLSELWSIIDWSLPGLLGPLETFRRTVALPIERDSDRKATERLQRLIRPFLLRRTKADEGIAPELPEKIERDVVVPLTDEQVTLYRATTEQILAEIAGSEGIDRRGLILRLLTALKQITNHPAHFLGEDGPLETRSGKLEMLDDLLRAAEASGEGTLIFTQYVAMANLIQSHQHDRGRSIAVLHGGLSVKARQALVDEFQAGELSTLVLSLKAGGTGLNLTAATNVVHYDRWWNPAVEDQATDRAYRIGQTKGVVVHRLITEGTVEDRVADLLRAKRALAASVTGGGESWIGELDDDDLAELVELSVN